MTLERELEQVRFLLIRKKKRDGKLDEDDENYLKKLNREAIKEGTEA